MATRFHSIALGLASALALSCQATKDVTNSSSTPPPPSQPPPSGSVITSVVASDASQPAAPGGGAVTVTGTATFTGLTVLLWNGQQWLTVASGSGTAAVAVGNGAIATTLVPATAIAAGTYSRLRLTAQSATLDVAVGGLNFSARTQATAQSLTLDKPVAVAVNPDGSRTLSVQFQLIRTVTLSLDATGVPMVTLSGDFGSVAARAATAPAGVVGSDVSQPVTTPAGMTVSGTATFTGLTLALWDGQRWWPVTNGAGSAAFTLANGAALVTLVPVSALPAGVDTLVQLTATNAVIDITLSGGGQQFSAGLQSNGTVSIVKRVTVTVNPDGSRTLAIALALVRTVSLTVDRTTGAASVAVTGDLSPSPLSAPAVRH